jgi:hypothetical protein
MELDRESIINSLSALSLADLGRKLFGSNGHDYKLHPILDSSALATFERNNRVVLPDDYRYFITSVGNGGAGPYYGIFKFGEEDSNWGYCAWDQGQLIGEVGRPFQHTRAWNADDDFWSRKPDFENADNDDAEDEMWERWDAELEKSYWCRSIMDGAIPICHLGCAKRQWLVINGPERGFIWNDDRCDEIGIYPAVTNELARMTFTNWYLTWLDAALSEFQLPRYAPTNNSIYRSRGSTVS